jgi:hypothetical protein
MNDDDLTEPTRQARRECLEWLSSCVRLGWLKTDLDALEALWWRYHDYRGRLVRYVGPVSAVNAAEPIERVPVVNAEPVPGDPIAWRD